MVRERLLRKKARGADDRFHSSMVWPRRGGANPSAITRLRRSTGSAELGTRLPAAMAVWRYGPTKDRGDNPDHLKIPGISAEGWCRETGSNTSAVISTLKEANRAILYFRSSRRALSSRSLRPFWKAGSFLRLSMCSAMAARITSDTGRASTFATVSKASACSAERRTVMDFTGFI